MANINKNELTKEQIQKAMNCETAEELVAVAKAQGIDLTKEEAEAYMAELDGETLKQAAGGFSIPFSDKYSCQEAKEYSV